MNDTVKPDADEQFSSLLEGNRTTLTGVQVLFGFLLIFPLQSGFETLQGFEEPLYVVALMSAAVAVVLLVAPSVHQRVRAPISGVPRRHVEHVKVGALLGIAGSVAALIALIASTWLALTVIYDNDIAVALGSVVLILAAWSWFWLPLHTFRDDN